MSDTNATKSMSADVKAIVTEAFANLEDFYAGVNKASDDLTAAENGRGSKRRDILDSCAALSLKHGFTDADIAAGVKAAIAAYQGNAIGTIDEKGNNKTLQNLASEIKNAMHPKVRGKLPELRKMASDIFTKREAKGAAAFEYYKRADIMVSRIAGDVASGKRLSDVPTSVAAINKRAIDVQAGNAENLSKAKGKVKAIIASCDDMARVFPLSQLDKIKALLGTLLEDDVLADALASTKKAAKAASNLRASDGKEKAAKAAPAEGASDMDAVLNDAA